MSHGFEIHDEGIIPADAEQFKNNGNRFLTLAEQEAMWENKINGKEVIKIINTELQVRK